MILGKETLDMFGYLPESVSKGSHKLVAFSCDLCGVIGTRKRKKCSVDTFCFSCARNEHEKISILRCIGVLSGKPYGGPRVLGEEDENQMISAYLSGSSQADAAKRFGLSVGVCVGALKRRGIVPRTARQTMALNGHTAGAPRKYNINHEFFNAVDSPTAAYVLGFIVADGCLYKNHLIFGLNHKDSRHLDKINLCMGSNYPVKERTTSNGHKAVTLRITSRPLTDALRRLGLTERKSLTAEVPNNIPPELERFFWAGVFDGDGSISKVVRTLSGSPSWSVFLCGSYDIVHGFAEFIERTVGRNAKPYPTKSIWIVRYSGVGVPQDVMSSFYVDLPISLDRKQALYSEMMKQKISPRSRTARVAVGLAPEVRRRKISDQQAVEIRRTYFSGEANQVQLAKWYGVSDATISMIVTGKRRSDLPGITRRRNWGKLSIEQVTEIRELWSQGIQQKELSARFGISQGNVSQIVNGISYK